MLNIYVEGRVRYTRQHILCHRLRARHCVLAFFIDQRVLGSGKDLMTTSLFTPNKYNPWYMPLLRVTGMMFSFTTGPRVGYLLRRLPRARVSVRRLGLAASFCSQHQPAGARGDGRLSDGGYPHTFHFGHTGAGDDRPSQRDLPSDARGDGVPAWSRWPLIVTPFTTISNINICMKSLEKTTFARASPCGRGRTGRIMRISYL